MSKLIADLSMSLDGFVAGPEQSMKDPLGIGGMQLHEWAFAAMSWREEHGQTGGEENTDSDHIDALRARVGAGIMARKMYSGGEGPWADDANGRGWWGENPPYHGPVFVLTHHARDSLQMEGGNIFHFVTDGIEAALSQAREAAGDRNVSIAGGASTVNQFLAAGLIDELRLHIAPMTLGAGERLFDGVSPMRLEPVSARFTPLVTHTVYRVLR